MLIGIKYGIIPDDHFWKNNPLQSLGSGIAAPVIYGRVSGTSGKGIDIHKAILKVAPKKKDSYCLGISILDLVTHWILN